MLVQMQVAINHPSVRQAVCLSVIFSQGRVGARQVVNAVPHPHVPAGRENKRLPSRLDWGQRLFTGWSGSGLVLVTTDAGPQGNSTWTRTRTAGLVRDNMVVVGGVPMC